MSSKFRPSSRPPEITFAALAVATGLLVWFYTVRSYRFRDQTSGRTSQGFLSSLDADRTIREAKSHLESNEEDMNAQLALGIAYYQKGKEFYPEGLKALRKATTLGALSPMIFFYGGIMYEGMGLYDYAIDQYQKYLRHNPGEYEISVRLGNVYFLTQQYDKAIVSFREGLKHWPKDPTSWMNYAAALRMKEEYGDALEALDRVKKLNHEKLPAGGYFEEGEIYRLQNKPDEASRSYEQELALQPDHLPTLQALETIYKQQNNATRLREVRSRIIEIRKRPKPTAPAPTAAPQKSS